MDKLNFAFSSIGNTLAVICHDAGSANLIVNWVNKYSGRMKLCAQGPAEKIFKNEFPNNPLLNLDETIQCATTVITGTGIRSDLEHHARIISKSKSIKSIAVLDHWINYRERFVRDGETVLPDEIWLSDDYAESLARQLFPDSPILKLPNLYLEKQVREVVACAPSPVRSPPKKILYLQEDMHVEWDSKLSGEPPRFQALEYFLDHLDELGVEKETVEVCIRPHPSEQNDEYRDWPYRYPNLNLTVRTDISLSQQIAWADWVIGCETFGLVVAIYAGRKCYSALPPWAHECRLPHDELIHICDLIGGG